MYSYNVKFLTCDESITLKNGDFKSYKYETKKKSEESVYDSGKRSFCERRGGHWAAVNPRQLKKLEANFRERTAVYCEWLNENLIVIVFSSGAIAYLTVKPSTLDVTQILFDRYVVGKISGQSVTGVAFCKSHLLFTHTDRTATLITFGKSIPNQPCRIKDRDPHLQTVELGGSRRTERRVSWCEGSGVRVLVWGAAAVEPAPWSPALEDQANLHLYLIRGQQMSLLAYHQLENETLCAEISSNNDNIIHIIEQTPCHKSGVTIEWSRYTAPTSELRAIRLRATNVERTATTLPAPARCVRRAGSRLLLACIDGSLHVLHQHVGITHEARLGSSSLCSNVKRIATLPAPARCVRRAGSRLLLACIDGSLHVLHQHVGITHEARLGSVATDVRWAGSLILAASDGLQCFDGALAVLPQPPHLSNILREPRRMHLLATRSERGGPLVLASFSGGPLALIRVSHPELMTAWIRLGRPSNAISLLRAQDWEESGAACLRAASALLTTALRGALRPDTEARAQAALGAYLAPKAPHAPNAQKYAPAVHDLARKFFHHLLRRGRVEKALSLCMDLAAWDLCMDARWAAARAGHPLWLPRQPLSPTPSTTKSVCSESCSQCSSDSSTSHPPLPRPPLPAPPLLPAPAPAPATTTSIRPNLHQYLEKNNTIWNTEVKDDWPDYRRESSIEVIPRPDAHFRHLYQTELREDAPNTMYRYNGYRPGSSERTLKVEGYERQKPEKNKVKFSDTVTIAVVASEGNVGSVARELADSLPLCAPHNYLAAFAPHPPHPPHPPPENAAQKPPKIKVVHFGMV
ncbi:WD repeat-containing and planar cell polarity effector protein fritz [Leguminivora glycinivorella]|uniref:WD repeat-containing and planar cell polarity effector protein fritz n=1 Tax=Leguminivora glycinivorella TaxID=1035111 RepID=UPI0020107557|nr:WD repeat-containing and planar cell polarity effector protein fritz [Leguminivora glycinivorella]